MKSFDDVHLHAGAIVGWQQTYDQLSAGHAHTVLRHVTGERFQIFQEALNKRVVQHGVAPRNRLCLAMPVGGAEPAVFQGKSMGTESVTLLHSGQEFFVQAAEGMDLLAITVEASRLESQAAREFTDAELRRLAGVSRLELRRDVLQKVRLRLESLVAAALLNEYLSEKLLEDLTLECMLDLLDHSVEKRGSRGGNHAVSAYLVRQSQELVLENSDEPVSVLDICERLNVSRRTLQRSFQTITGLRPVEYLRSVRLNAARRRLRVTDANEITVARVASDFGFTHLGHFSGYYKALFGEYPSHTTRK
ncbi:helix-turn-helix domain-containing protein [Pseudomonas mediterranea]|uniref:helix-turn-helix domain-containing protein n=1 Tax=Pseudomonas mediterranea TaxID=183795 RepID=UPI001F4CCE51|nr:helix-turn-helix domain-containing protein [Pseudomonas mediterranea]MDU9031243.1 helix-turn-helix domain-containing protein [Pseudomonas mediterranea]